MRVPPFLSLAFPSFFPSPPASLFHPLRPVTNTQSRRCPYRKSPTHREERGGTGVCACLAAWATPPNRVSSADELTEKCTVHLHLQGEPWITIHLWKFHRPVSDTLHESRSNAWNFHWAANYELFRYSTTFHDILVNRFAMNWITIANLIYEANDEWKK